MRWARILIAAVLAAASATFAVPPSAWATNFVVNSTADPANPDNACTANPGGCTLRDALDDAGPSDAVIVPGGTYTLTQGPLLPAGDVITGAGARSTIIDGGGTGKVVYVTAGSNQLTGVTLRNGGGVAIQASPAGGAVLVAPTFAAASLTLVNTTVRDSRSTAGAAVSRT